MADQVRNHLANLINGVPNIVLAVTAGVCLIISLNGIRYERFSFLRGSLYIVQLLLEFAVIQLFFPITDMGPFFYGGAVAIQALILRLYSMIKSKEIHNGMVKSGEVAASLGRFFWASIVVDVIAVIVLTAGFLMSLNILLMNGTLNVGGQAITGQVLLVFGGLILLAGYILYGFFLGQLFMVRAPRVINRMLIAQFGQFFFVPLLIGLTLGLVQQAFNQANINTAGILVNVLIAVFVVNKLLSTTLIGYTFWDICLFTAAESDQENTRQNLENTQSNYVNMI